MDPRHPFRGSMGSFIAVVALAAAPACGSSETGRSDASADPDVESTRQPISSQPSKFTLFESGQVRPLALSPDKQHLFAVNTPDNRLEVYRVQQHQLIPVGLEPVAVAARSGTAPTGSTRSAAPRRPREVLAAR